MSDFWLERWEQGQIGFHQDEVHPDLLSHGDWLLGRPARVLVPLCGKTWDLPWLAQRGAEVVGVELAERAVRALMEEHALPYTVEDRGEHRVFTSGTLSVWCGDFFALPAELGPFSGVWDRAALVALPPELREAYAAQIRRLAPGGRLLQNVVEYDEQIMSGPPFSVSAEVLRALYGPRVQLVVERDVIATEPRWRERGHRWFRSSLYEVSLG